MMNTKSFRAIYLQANTYATVDFEDLESRGITDIIQSIGGFTYPDLTVCKQKTGECLARMEGTNLKLHLLPTQFRDGNEQLVDPSNEAQITQVASNAAELVAEYGINVSLDDYYYPSSFYDAGKETEQRQALVDFANALKTAIHDVNSDSKLSAAMSPTDGYRASKISLITQKLDFAIPMCYRYYRDTHYSVITKLDGFLKESECSIVAGLMTYTDDTTHTLRSVKELNIDIETILRSKASGYAMWVNDYCSGALKFPNYFRKSVNRKVVTRRSKS